MNFELTGEEFTIKEKAKAFAKQVVAPLSSEIDKRKVLPDRLRVKAAEEGLYSIVVPRRYGGLGKNFLSYVLVLEEIAKASMAVSLSIAVQFLVEDSLLLYGTKEQKERYLPALASAEKIGCFAFTEPQTGSDPKAIKTRAQETGQGFRLNGKKCLICNASLADIAIIFARDKNGLSAFIVETNKPGFSAGEDEELMGLNGLKVGNIYLRDVEVSKDSLLGERGNGFEMLLKLISHGKTGIAAQAVGLSQAALDEAVKYARERRQKNRPISSFQVIQWMLAEMAAWIEAARLLTYKTAYAVDKGKEVFKEAAMAKLLASEVAEKVTSYAVQVHGSYGYLKRFKVERLYRDAKALGVIEGSSEIQRVIIASNLVRDCFKTL